MKKRLWLVIAAALMVTGLATGAARAGRCDPLKHATPYLLQLDRDEIDTGHNMAGQRLPDAVTFHLANQFPMECRCEGGSAALYYRSVSLLPPGYHDGELTYFVVNRSLQIGIKLGIKDTPPIPVPFDDLPDGGSYACGSDGSYYHPTDELGSHGTLSLYVSRGFIGELDIPLTRLMEIYARWGTQAGYGTEPVSRVSVFGSLIVPQTCLIDDGEVININLGRLRSADLLIPGAMPVHYVPQLITLNYQCQNIADTMHLELTLMGEESTAQPGVLQSSNPDVGVRMADAQMAPLEINSSRLPLPLTFDPQGQSGRQSFYAWPVNTTGKPPAGGPFSASALMEVEIQ